MSYLLCRSAECMFWLARYMERIENLARIIDITETFARDRGGRNWLSVVQINADEERFFEKHKLADASTVLDFYLRDASNFTSIQASNAAAHENARTLRPLISIELWTQINMLHTEIRNLASTDIELPKVSKLCGGLRAACQAHTGIMEGTVMRDQAWHFYGLGKQLERADQTTRVLDIKYHLLLPRSEDVGSALDLSQWNALLRAVAGYQAFRRLYQGGVTPNAVAGFMLFSDSFPRSVSLCVRQVQWYLDRLRSGFGLTGIGRAQERVYNIRTALDTGTIENIIGSGLHQFIDWMQQELGEVAAEISQAFFAPAKSQKQG